jgi:hypothetical protein
MTANLLAHTSIFRAGIARSGAYNRTLTPFGFQGEERSYWQAQDLYEQMSPFTYADKIKTPILLIHGMADNNTGTYPMQSERMFAALKGNGGTTRYVQLPGGVARLCRARKRGTHVVRDARLARPVREAGAAADVIRECRAAVATPYAKPPTRSRGFRHCASPRRSEHYPCIRATAVVRMDFPRGTPSGRTCQGSSNRGTGREVAGDDRSCPTGQHSRLGRPTTGRSGGSGCYGSAEPDPTLHQRAGNPRPHHCGRGFPCLWGVSARSCSPWRRQRAR